MSNILIRGVKYLISPTMDGGLRIEKDRDVLVEDGVITCISSRCSHPRDAEVIDAGKHIVLPAFIDLHTHLETSILHGVMPDSDYKVFYPLLENLLKHLGLDELKLSLRIGCYKMLFNGVIGFIDYSTTGRYDLVLESCRDLGLYMGMGPVDPDVKVVEEYAETRHRRREGFLPVINISRPYMHEPEYFHVLKSSVENSEIIVGVHVSETRREVYLSKKRRGLLPVEYLFKTGILGGNTLLYHLNWVTSTEIEYISEKGSGIAIAPRSATRLAIEGFTPVYEIIEKKIPVGIGSDGVAGDTYSILEAIRDLILLYRNNYWDTRLSLKLAYPRIILNNYKITGIRGGVIEEGSPAHLLLLEIDDIKHRPLVKDNILASILLSSGNRVYAVISRGRILYWRDESIKQIEEYRRLVEKAEKILHDKIDLYNGVLVE